MAKFHLIPIVLGAAIGVGVYVVSKYLALPKCSIRHPVLSALLVLAFMLSPRIWLAVSANRL